MELLKYLAKRIISGVLHLLWLFPIQKDKVLFINDHSYNFSDNLKYLALFLIERKPDQYKLFFSLKEKEGIEDYPITPVQFLSLKHFYHAITCSVLITNNGGTAYLPIRKKQLVINTWHGGGPYKVTGTKALKDYYNMPDDIEVEDLVKSDHSKRTDELKKWKKLIYWFEKDSKYNAQKVNYILSSCKICTDEEAKGMFYTSEQCLDSGSPRIDSFFQKEKMLQAKKKVYQYYQINENTRVIIYAPTFRGFFDDYTGAITNEALELDYEKITDVVREKFGGTWQFAVRLHPRLKNIRFDETNLINMTLYPDSEELLMAADILITDYSSVMWDYSFSRKPCFLFATDINDYEVKRGFYVPPDEWPFPIASSNKELAEIISDFRDEQYRLSVEEHYNAVGSYEKGHACEITQKLIDDHIKQL